MRSTLLISLLFAAATAYAQNDCAVKLGNNYYISCKHILVVNHTPALDVKFGTDGIPLLSGDIFDTKGILQATMEQNKIKTGDSSRYKIKISTTEIAVNDARNNALLYLLKKDAGDTKYSCVWGVFANINLADGGFIYITPDETNVPSLQYINGATFKSMETAVEINY